MLVCILYESKALCHLVPPLAKVDLAHPVRVEWVALVGVDHHHEEA